MLAAHSCMHVHVCAPPGNLMNAQFVGRISAADTVYSGVTHWMFVRDF